MLEQKEKLPVVAFTFSRDRCNGNADSLASLDLTTSTEKHEIDSFFHKSIQLLKGSDQSLPQVNVCVFILKIVPTDIHTNLLCLFTNVLVGSYVFESFILIDFFFLQKRHLHC